jgi:hypothetical protein
MKIVLASRNKKKIKELEDLLAKHIPEIEVFSLDDIGFEGEIVEDGEGFYDNAYIKASTSQGSDISALATTRDFALTRLAAHRECIPQDTRASTATTRQTTRFCLRTFPIKRTGPRDSYALSLAFSPMTWRPHIYFAERSRVR